MTTASASNNKVEVIISENGQSGLPGVNGTNGAGFNSVRKSKIDNPLLHILKRNKLEDTISGAITWSRSTTATYIDMYGVLKTAAIDEPREEASGWLIEGESTNSFIYSEVFPNAAWSKNNCSILTGQGDDPKEGGTSNRLTVASNGDAYFEQLFSRAEGQAYAISCYFRKISTDNVCFITTFGDTTTVDLSNGSILSEGNSHKANSRILKNGWIRLEVAVLNPTLGDEFTRIGVQGGASNNNTDFWGAQAEQLPFATSYMQTVASTTTRTSDNISLSAVNNMPSSSSDSSIVLSSSFLGGSNIKDPSFRHIYRDNSTTLNAARERGDTAGLNVFISNADIDLPTTLSTSETKFTLSNVSEGGFSKIYVNGVIDGVSSPVTQANYDGTTLYIGGDSVKGDMYGHILDFRIYDFAVNAQEAQFLSGS